MSSLVVLSIGQADSRMFLSCLHVIFVEDSHFLFWLGYVSQVQSQLSPHLFSCVLAFILNFLACRINMFTKIISTSRKSCCFRWGDTTWSMGTVCNEKFFSFKFHDLSELFLGRGNPHITIPDMFVRYLVVIFAPIHGLFIG